MRTSSISAASMPARRMASSTAMAPSRGAGTSTKTPPIVPTGVRTALMMTASSMLELLQALDRVGVDGDSSGDRPLVAAALSDTQVAHVAPAAGGCAQGHERTMFAARAERPLARQSGRPIRARRQAGLDDRLH